MALTSQDLQRALAQALDDLWTVIVASSSATSFSAAALTNATSGAATTRLNARWAYPATGTSSGQQRQVRTGGYTPSTGTVVIWPNWTAPPASSEIDLTALFPRVSAAANVAPTADVDYRTLSTRALDRYPIADEVTFTTTAGSYSVSLATYAAWMNPGSVLRLLGPPLVAGYPPQDDSWRIDQLRIDNGTPTLYLRAPYAGTETARMAVVRPASTLINGAESTTGLSAETGTVSDSVRLEDFLILARAEAYRALAVRGHTGQPWAALADRQEALARETIVALDAIARGQADPRRQMPKAVPAGAAA